MAASTSNVSTASITKGAYLGFIGQVKKTIKDFFSALPSIPSLYSRKTTIAPQSPPLLRVFDKTTSPSEPVPVVCVSPQQYPAKPLTAVAVSTHLGATESTHQESRAPVPTAADEKTASPPKHAACVSPQQYPAEPLTAVAVSTHLGATESTHQESRAPVPTAIDDNITPPVAYAAPQHIATLPNVVGAPTHSDTTDSPSVAAPLSIIGKALQTLIKSEPPNGSPETQQNELARLRQLEAMVQNQLTTDKSGDPQVVLSGARLQTLLKHPKDKPARNPNRNLMYLLHQQQECNVSKLKQLREQLSKTHAALEPKSIQWLLQPVSEEGKKIIALISLLNQYLWNRADQLTPSLYHQFCELLDVASLDDVRIPQEPLESLSQLTATSKVSATMRQQQTIQILSNLAQGLQSLHQNKKVHGSLSPKNIGIGQQSQLSKDTKNVGHHYDICSQSPESVPPEAITTYARWMRNPTGFQPNSISTTKKDIYALGVAMLQLMNYMPINPSFDGITNIDTIQEWRNQVVQARSLLSQQADKTALDELILDMTDDAPLKRPSAEKIGRLLNASKEVTNQ